MSKNIAIIFAGGSGERMGSGIPKQFIEVEGKPIIIHTLEIFEEHPLVDAIYVACRSDYIKKLERMTKKSFITKISGIVPGGMTGQESIYKGLKAAFDSEGPDNVVLIHDGVRPCITPDTITRNIEVQREKGTAITCNKFFETPAISKDSTMVDSLIDREEMYVVQAPQTFNLGEIISEHDKLREINPTYKGVIDSCTLMKNAGKDIFLVEGNRGNIKVTTPEDLYVFRAMLDYKEYREALGLSDKEIKEHLKKQ